jgi:enoyl-[acyl-carrier protein] reductase III
MHNGCTTTNKIGVMMSYHSLKGQVALVTGGARGIGRATILKLAQNGCDIVCVYFNSSDKADSLVNEVLDMGQKAIAVQANVADEKSIKEMYSYVNSQFDSLDILVSNAASGVLKPQLKMGQKHWDWCMNTNALALHHLAKYGQSMMKPGSKIIALSSLGAQKAIPNYAFIGASKAALESLVRSLSLELAEDGIRVNAISAGVVDTDALKYFPNREQLLNSYKRRSLTKQDLLPADVANAIYLLCLPEAQMIRGQTLFVDAGYSVIG